MCVICFEKNQIGKYVRHFICEVLAMFSGFQAFAISKNSQFEKFFFDFLFRDEKNRRMFQTSMSNSTSTSSAQNCPFVLFWKGRRVLRTPPFHLGRVPQVSMSDEI